MAAPPLTYGAGYARMSPSLQPITPSDITDLAESFHGFYVGDTSGGTAIKIRQFKPDGASQDITIPGLIQGNFYPFQFSRVWVTGTTAASIFGLR
jgi:hypothetical protein